MDIFHKDILKDIMFSDFLIGSIIILVPLGILILTLAVDLNMKEQQLSRRIKKLNMIAGSLTEKKITDLNSVLGGLDLDEQDRKQVEKLANQEDIINNKENGLANDPIEDYALAAKNVATMRFEEKLLLSAKIRYFKIYAAVMYILIWVSLGILPLLYDLGFHWDWK
jgi:hypothetical protein